MNNNEKNELETLEKLIYVAPLDDDEYARYVELCRQANKKPVPNE